MPEPFEKYLGDAVRTAVRRATRRQDGGSLWRISRLCRRGVKRNWNSLGERAFLAEFLWVVGAIQKPVVQHERYYPLQLRLFRRCSASAIVRDRALILDRWQTKRLDMNRRMVNAMFVVASRIATERWDAFKRVSLPLPDNPESENPEAWQVTYAALDALPMIGEANVWFLLRNLLGAPFIKPDLHIKAIAAAFFGSTKDPLRALSAGLRVSWPRVCRTPRLLPVHLGVADYILWDYRRQTGRPV